MNKKRLTQAAWYFIIRINTGKEVIQIYEF